MDWLIEIRTFWLTTLAWVVGLAAVFGLLARLMPCNPGMYWWKNLRAAGTDIFYWFLVPLALRLCQMALLIVGVALLFGGREPRFLPVQGLPLWQQGVLILLLQDVLLYWIHRLFHTRRAWKFHAVHHSPTVLDWTSAARFHPVNHLLAFTLADMAVLLLGFAPQALVLLTPFNIIYSAMVHANLNWTFGPLRYVFASPVFHRWHHTTREEGLNKNFASTFPLLDVIFGTFYLPTGTLPEQYGSGEADLPEGFGGQIAYPFGSRAVGAWTWACRRPIAAGLLAMTGLAAVGLLARGIAFTSQVVQQNEQLLREVQWARFQQLQAEAARHATQMDLALRAWADNDLVGATAILDGVGGPFRQSEQQQELRDLCRRKCLLLSGHAGPVLGVAISTDGRCVVSGSADGTVRIWDAATGQETRSLKGHTGTVTSVAISADGRRVVSGGNDRTVRVWEAATGQAITLQGHTSAVLSVALIPDSGLVLSGGAEAAVKVWNTGEKRERFTMSGPSGAITSVASSADGRRVVAASGNLVAIWDAQTGREERAPLRGHNGPGYGVAISPDGQRIVSGGCDQLVKVWDIPTGQVLTLTGHTAPVIAVAIAADGQRIVSGSKDGTVKVWDAATGREELTLKGHRDSVTSVAISPEGRHVVSGSRDGTVRVWDVEQCRLQTPPPWDDAEVKRPE